MANDNPTRLTLKNVRISYPHIWKPQKFDDNDSGTAKYNLAAIIDPETKWGQANIDKIEDAIDFVMSEKWPKKRPNLPDDKYCLREGNDKVDVPPEYEDMYYLSASNERQPLIIDRDSTELIEEDDVIYSGCYCDLIVNIWAQDNKYGKRVNASLEAVRFREDGEALTSARRATADDFEDDDEDEPKSRRRGRGRDRDEDDEDEPKSRRRGRGRDRDEDDEDEPKSRRRGRGRGRDRDEDEDDEDEPKSRRRGRGRDRDEDEDDDEDEPKNRRRGRGRGRDRDEDDEDEPKSRRRGRGRRGRDDDDIT